VDEAALAGIAGLPVSCVERRMDDDLLHLASIRGWSAA